MPVEGSDLHFASASELAALIQKRDLSPVEFMRATLERIEKLNSRLNAFVYLRPPEQLLEEARSVADRLARGEDLGPLAGLPLGVKDLEDAAGLPTTHGSLLFKDFVAERDTIQVERLRRVGAIVIGKTNTPEFGYTAFTTNRVFGPTRNPWNEERTPGGSSGGSAAALASGLVALATASDGGGSARIPASYTGLLGLKPTNGRIPWGPEEMLRLSGCAVSGPLTRSAADAALWLDATVGPHALDPFSLPHPGFSYRDAVRREPPPLRIAYTPSLGYARPEGAVQREVEAALQDLDAAGHRVEPVDFSIPDVAIDWVRLMTWEDYGFVHPHLGDESLLDPGYAAGFGMARATTADQLGQVQRLRVQLLESLAELFAGFDLLATPTVATVAFAAEGPLPFSVEGVRVETPGGGLAYTYPFNFSGNPAISMRAGLSDERLPIGLQLVGPRLCEELLLQVAAQYEQLRPWDEWPSL